jgi:DNA-directed RNA polymerase subunit RPC12/RpoP
MIHFNCSSCQKALKVEDRGAGRRISCPRCQQKTVVPSPDIPTVDYVAQEDEPEEIEGPEQFPTSARKIKKNWKRGLLAIGILFGIVLVGFLWIMSKGTVKKLL